MLAGTGIVLVMHLPLGWALVTSLGRKVVVVAPVETKIIEEIWLPLWARDGRWRAGDAARPK